MKSRTWTIRVALLGATASMSGFAHGSARAAAGVEMSADGARTARRAGYCSSPTASGRWSLRPWSSTTRTVKLPAVAGCQNSASPMSATFHS